MNNFSAYSLGVQAADELLIPIGLMPERANKTYAEFVLLGFFLSGLAAKTFLNRDFSKDVFISTLLLRRDEFFDGNIVDLSSLVESAHDEYVKIMTYWPGYRTQKYYQDMAKCLFNRLATHHNYVVDERNHDMTKAKLASVMTAIENVCIAVAKCMEQDSGRNLAIEKPIQIDNSQILGSPLAKENQYIKKYYPTAIILTVLMGGILSMIIHMIIHKI